MEKEVENDEVGLKGLNLYIYFKKHVKCCDIGCRQGHQDGKLIAKGFTQNFWQKSFAESN